MFGDGEYQINNPQAKMFLRKIARVIRTMPEGLEIEVAGYASVGEVHSSTIPRDSWDISALRSIEIVKTLIKNKIDPSRLKVAAFGSYRPKSDNYNENRRVELKFRSNGYQKPDFGNENFFDRIQN